MKGKTIALEEGFVEHLLLLKGLEMNKMEEGDITIKNTPTNNTPQVFATGEVDAVAAWQPNSGQALKMVAGSKSIFSSKDVPGLIYDALYCDRDSVKKKRAEWLKVVKVWYRIIEYLSKDSNLDEALVILAGRVGVTPAEYEPLLEGTHLLSPKEALKVWEKEDGLKSIYGSSKIVDDFNVKFKVYEKPAAIDAYLDPTLTKEVLGK